MSRYRRGKKRFKKRSRVRKYYTTARGGVRL